jgi:hypothetical protein
MSQSVKSFTSAHHAQGLKSARMMESQGGFCEALARAYYRADLQNARALYFAFEHLFAQAPYVGKEEGLV